MLLLIAGVVVVAAVRHTRAIETSAAPVATTTASTSNQMNQMLKSGRYVARQIGNQTVLIDGQTGQVRPLTPEEAQRLADGLKGMLNRSSEGLQQVTHPDGTVSMDLQGRFQNVAVAKKTVEGIEQGCVDNPQSAAAFFQIDPKLLEKPQP